MFRLSTHLFSSRITTLRAVQRTPALHTSRQLRFFGHLPMSDKVVSEMNVFFQKTVQQEREKRDKLPVQLTEFRCLSSSFDKEAKEVKMTIEMTITERSEGDFESWFTKIRR